MIENEENDLLYDYNESARIILDNISKKLRKKIKINDIKLLLNFKYEYLEMEGYIPDEIIVEDLSSVNENALNNFVLQNAVLRKIYLSSDELDEVWDAEQSYLNAGNDLFEYIVEDAAMVVYDSISPNLQEKLSFDDIIKILDFKFDYLESVNIAGDSEMPQFDTPITADLDGEALDDFAIANAVKEDIYLSKDELGEIWDGELKYFELNGQLGEDVPPEMN